jgi:hypothetical protein
VTEGEISHLATPANVPYPISRRMLLADVERVLMGRQEQIPTESLYYGPQESGSGASIFVEVRPLPGSDPKPIDVEKILVCDLSDNTVAGGWHHTPPPAGMVALDPFLGRIAFGDQQDRPPLVTFHYGFSADVGGGEYDRIGSFAVLDGPRIVVSTPATPASSPPLTAGLTAIPDAIKAFKVECTAKGLDPDLCNHAAVEIVDGGRYEETPEIETATFRLELRAADQTRPALILGGELTITGDPDSELNLNGLLIAGGALRVNGPGRVRLRHCTLVPGTSLKVDGNPSVSGAPSLIVESPQTEVEIDSCILGGLRVDPDAVVTIRNSIVDGGKTRIAYAADADDEKPGGRLTLENCTVLGAVYARVIALASNTIFLATPADANVLPVRAEQRQEGCVRFSYLPAGSRTPRRHRCQPEADADALRLQPVLTSDRYGDPGYCQLDRRTPAEIRGGADDESEMGVFHDLFQPQREAYLARRLNEYLRFGLEVGLFFAT